MIKKTTEIVLLFVLLYSIAALVAYAGFTAFHLWPHDIVFFLSWPKTIIIAAIEGPEIHAYDRTLFILMIFILQFPVAFGLWCRRKWYGPTAIIITLWLQIFLAALIDAGGV